MVTLHHGDCLDVLKTLPDNSVDSIVTDPPYGLAFMGKRWDYDIPSVDIWRECLRVLKPGGHALIFGGTRTYHRMTCRVEDAGFEIRDMIAWVYGSGFPKSLDVSKAIDKAAGAEREVIGSGKGRTGAAAQPNGGSSFSDDSYQWPGDYDITAPATEAAKQWAGWGTALKPALEPITMARKPLEGTVAASVMEHGTGALNIDGCRVAAPGEVIENHGRAPTVNGWDVRMSGGQSAGQTSGQALGRFPANLIHDGSDEVVAAFPTTAPAKAAARGELSDIRGDNFNRAGGKRVVDSNSVRGHTDNGGSAARFFYCAKASKRDRDDGVAGGMRGRQDGSMGSVTMRKNHHPTVKPTDLMRYLCRLITPPNGVVLDPFMGSGSTGKAAVLEGFRFIGIEREAEYVRIASARIEHAHNQQNHPLHPD